LTFALEQGGGASGLGGLASQFGFSMGGGGEGLGGDNLLSLMKSRRIVQDVLLSTIYVEGDSVLLLDQYLRSSDKLMAKWDSLGIYPVDPLKCCDPKQDSAIGVVVKAVSEKHAIPYDFLQQISLKLRRAGLTRSVRGPGGGIVRAHTEISLHEVDRVMSSTRIDRSCPLENLIAKKFEEINVLA
jgi:hypothetical protein